MRIKLDENLPERLVGVLSAHGHDVHTVPDENLSGRPDADIWQAACAEGRFLITQDLDFSDTRRFAPGTHAGLLLLRLREPGAQAFASAVAAVAAEIDGWQGCLWSRRKTSYGSSVRQKSVEKRLKLKAARDRLPNDFHDNRKHRSTNADF